MRGTDFGGDESPRRRVTISKPFELGKYEVTQEQWQAVMGRNPQGRKCPRCPAEGISWNDAQKFIAKLNESDAGHTYRLPSEAEWEYAARAGVTTDYVKSYDELAWYAGNSGVIVKQEVLNIKAHPVGTKKPNAWGLYDMSGNVAEWCQDWYQSNYYELSPAIDPPGPARGRVRVYRGGSYGSFPDTLRAAYRAGGNPDTKGYQTGLRLVREARP
jgi:formylglycine-generating enzyme required for sulfatase activity